MGQHSPLPAGEGLSEGHPDLRQCHPAQENAAVPPGNAAILAEAPSPSPAQCHDSSALLSLRAICPPSCRWPRGARLNVTSDRPRLIG